MYNLENIYGLLLKCLVFWLNTFLINLIYMSTMFLKIAF